MPDVPTAFLLHGYIGSGKTTLAKQLEKAQGAVRFTHDEWMRKLYGPNPPAADFNDCAQRVSSVMETLWTRCLTLKLDVILDFGFWKRTYRDRIRARVEELGCKSLLLRVSCSEDVAWERVNTRNAEEPSSSLYISRNTFDVLKQRFEPLGADEHFLDVSEENAYLDMLIRP